MRNLFPLFFLILGLGAQAEVSAATQCAKSVSQQLKISRTDGAEKLIKTYEPLVSRVLAARQKGSFESALNVYLKRSERNDFARGLVLVLKKVRNHADEVNQQLIATHSKRAADFSQVLVNLNQLESRVLASRNKSQYVESLVLSLQITSVALFVDSLYRLKNDPIAIENYWQINGNFSSRFNHYWKFEKFDNESDLIKKLISRGIVPIPTHMELSIVDFNYLVGSGIAPVGLSAETLHVDGRLMNPDVFFRHDLSHAFGMAAKFNHKQRVFWNQLLSKIESEDPRSSAIMHLFMFFLSHERIQYSKDIMNVEMVKWLLSDEEKSTTVTLSRSKSVYDFFVKESFFGVSELQKEVPTREEVSRVEARLIAMLSQLSK